MGEMISREIHRAVFQEIAAKRCYLYSRDIHKKIALQTNPETKALLEEKRDDFEKHIGFYQQRAELVEAMGIIRKRRNNKAAHPPVEVCTLEEMQAHCSKVEQRLSELGLAPPNFHALLQQMINTWDLLIKEQWQKQD